MSDQFMIMPRILNSALGGIVASTLVYPIDLVKTRFQTQTITPDGKPTYKSIGNAFVQIHRHEGFQGLYRGLAFSVLMVTPELITNIAGNDFFRLLLHPGKGETESLFRQTMAGACTGLLTTFITSPMEFIKIQLQDEGRLLAEEHAVGTARPRLTARQVIVNVFRKSGFLGIFQGIVPCALRDIPFSIMYFPLFAYLYNKGPKRPNGEATYAWSLASGLVAGSASAFVLTPVDVVKTRLQTLHDTGQKYSKEYNGLLDYSLKIYKNEGIHALFRGAGCRVLVIAPLFGFTEMIYYFGVAEKLLGLPEQTFVR